MTFNFDHVNTSYAKMNLPLDHPVYKGYGPIDDINELDLAQNQADILDYKVRSQMNAYKDSRVITSRSERPPPIDYFTTPVTADHPDLDDPELNSLKNNLADIADAEMYQQCRVQQLLDDGKVDDAEYLLGRDLSAKEIETQRIRYKKKKYYYKQKEPEVPKARSEMQVQTDDPSAILEQLYQDEPVELLSEYIGPESMSFEPEYTILDKFTDIDPHKFHALSAREKAHIAKLAKKKPKLAKKSKEERDADYFERVLENEMENKKATHKYNKMRKEVFSNNIFDVLENDEGETLSSKKEGWKPRKSIRTTTKANRFDSTDPQMPGLDSFMSDSPIHYSTVFDLPQLLPEGLQPRGVAKPKARRLQKSKVKVKDEPKTPTKLELGAESTVWGAPKKSRGSPVKIESPVSFHLADVFKEEVPQEVPKPAAAPVPVNIKSSPAKAAKKRSQAKQAKAAKDKPEIVRMAERATKPQLIQMVNKFPHGLSKSRLEAMNKNNLLEFIKDQAKKGHGTKGRKRKMNGRGHEVTSMRDDVPFGKFSLDMKKLSDNRVSLAYPHNHHPVTGIPMAWISNRLKQVIMEILNDMPVNLNDLNEAEARYLDMILKKAKVRFNNRLSNNDNELIKRLQMLIGTIGTGNNSKLVKNELSQTLNKLCMDGLISTQQVKWAIKKYVL